MAVVKTQEWTALVSGTNPSGTATIGGGSNRVLIMLRGIEHTTQNASGSCAIGGVPATGRVVSSANGDSEYQQAEVFYWTESDLESMSGNTISFSDPVVQTKKYWSYATFSSCDQAAPIVVNTTANANVSVGQDMRVATGGTSGDYTIAYIVCTGSSRWEWDAGITEVWDQGTGGTFANSMAAGAWQANQHDATTPKFAVTVAGLGIVLKQEAGTGGGIGSLTAPAALVSGSAERYDGLIAASPQVAGVAERIIYWQGGVDLVAPEATSSTDFSFTLFFGSGSAEPQLFEVTGFGTRGSNGTGSAVAPLPILTSYSPEDILGTGSCDAPLPTVVGTDVFAATWYTAKSVYFWGV